MRADARRNRRAILEAASALFAEQGLGASVQEVARRARVGTGTVSRHFATKEDLFEAILSNGMDDLVVVSRALRTEHEPGRAFLGLLDAIVEAGARDRGLAQRLSAALGAGDHRVVGPSVQALCDELEEALSHAQAAGLVRRDVDLGDVEALLDACMSRPETARVMLAVVKRGITIDADAHKPSGSWAESRHAEEALD